MANIVNDYGAVADGQWALATVTLSLSTPNTLSSTTAIWIPARDAASFISVPKAGSGGGKLNTKITAVAADGKSVTLADPGVTAVTASPSLVTWGVTDNRGAFDTFTAANPGATVTLVIPAGTYYVSYGNPMFDGIANLTVNGTGAILACGIFQFGSQNQFQDHNHSARTQSVKAGSSSITLKTLADTSLFTVGRYALMTGLSMQSGGFPSNQFFFEYVLITAIDAGTGIVTFSAPLKSYYLSTWPTFPSGLGEVDLGGPATLYALPASWNCQFVYNGLTIAQDAQYGSAGRSISWNNCTFIGVVTETVSGPFPTVCQSFTMTNCTATNCTMEMDKLIETVTFDNTTIGCIANQSSSVNNTIVKNGSVVGLFLGTNKKMTVDGSTVNQFVPGPLFFGRSDELIFRNAVINQLDMGGLLDKGGSGDPGLNNVVGASMNGGVITMPKSYGIPPWGVPDTWCFWSDPNGWCGNMFRVNAVWDDAVNIYIQTSTSGSWPTPPNNATNIWIRVHPTIKFTCTGSSGTDTQIAGLNQHPPGNPLFSFQQHTYTSGSAKAASQPTYNVLGNLDTLTVDVTHAYASGALTFTPGHSWPIINSKNNPGVTIFYDAVVNAAIQAKRTIRLSGVTGSQSLDTGLAVPDSVKTIFTGPCAGVGAQFSSDVSGTDPLVSVTVTFQAISIPQSVTPLQLRLHA